MQGLAFTSYEWNGCCKYFLTIYYNLYQSCYQIRVKYSIFVSMYFFQYLIGFNLGKRTLGRVCFEHLRILNFALHLLIVKIPRPSLPLWFETDPESFSPAIYFSSSVMDSLALVF
jgi:hypothetical protein